MVECYWPGITEDQVREVLERSGLSSCPPGQAKVQLLGSLLVPSDGMVIFLFEATSAAAVREAAKLADVPFDPDRGSPAHRGRGAQRRLERVLSAVRAKCERL